MSKLDEYLDRARDLAEDAGDVAKNFAGEVMSRAKDLTDERSKVRELAQSAREQTGALTLGAKEKVQGVLQDAKAGKEIRLGITELENLPEFEGSIIYKMELEAAINGLKSLLAFIDDGRLDDASVVEEVRKVMGKVEPAAPAADDSEQQLSAEDQAIENVKTIAYSACARALGVLTSAE